VLELCVGFLQRSGGPTEYLTDGFNVVVDLCFMILGHFLSDAIQCFFVAMGIDPLLQNWSKAKAGKGFLATPNPGVHGDKTNK